MSIPSTESMALASEQRAEAAEQSPIPTLLRIGKVLVWIVWALVLVTAILLLLAFFLRLGGANPDAGFVQWVERSVDRAMGPFRGIFPTRELTGDSVLDMSLLFAAVCYFVAALLIDALLRWITSRLQRQERDTARLRADADQLGRQAAAEQHARELAAHEAAATAYAREQAAAQQYAVAQAAAADAIAQQAARDEAADLRSLAATPTAPGSSAAAASLAPPAGPASGTRPPDEAPPGAG